jgi:hypothetical protein
MARTPRWCSRRPPVHTPTRLSCEFFCQRHILLGADAGRTSDRSSRVKQAAEVRPGAVLPSLGGDRRGGRPEGQEQEQGDGKGPAQVCEERSQDHGQGTCANSCVRWCGLPQRWVAQQVLHRNATGHRDGCNRQPKLSLPTDRGVRTPRSTERRSRTRTNGLWSSRGKSRPSGSRPEPGVAKVEESVFVFGDASVEPRIIKAIKPMAFGFDAKP